MSDSLKHQFFYKKKLIHKLNRARAFIDQIIKQMSIIIGSTNLTLDNFYRVVAENCSVEISSESVEKIIYSRNAIEKIVASGTITYGVNTGFGSLSTKVVPQCDLLELQRNLILSHAIGCGPTAPDFVVRGMLLLRLVCVCRGHSGVRLTVAKTLRDALNKGFMPYVPTLGTVGASGDLAPLSHLIMTLMGEGQAKTLTCDTYRNAAEVLSELGIEPLVLQAKEGLALNNGTQFITSYAAMAIYKARKLLHHSNKIAALSIEALHGTHLAFDPAIHQAKGHAGQIKVAEEIRSYLFTDEKGPSAINRTWCGAKVQDAYSLRCIPQIHGAVLDQIDYVEKIVVTEMNSANDNPLIFGDTVLSGGNFHGMYISMAADNLAIAMATLCNISERRLERLLNPALNGFLPSFLTLNAGLNSGLMIVQYASAGITAENRQLANPSSCHNIPTCQGTEDVVSMGGHASRKALNAVENSYRVLAYELLAAQLAMDYTKEKPHAELDAFVTYFKTNLPRLDKDRYMKEDLDFIIQYLHCN